jgi:transcriptional regulator with XRE-family HTH domain
MINRIKELILQEGLTSGSFADAIGVQRSSISHILNGRNNPSLDFVIKTLQRFPRINSEWLLMGVGNMYNNGQPATEQPVRELSIFKSIPEPAPEPAPKRFIKPDEKVPDIQVDTTESTSRLVNKVLIFYSDHTYDEFFKSGEGERGL